MSKQKTTTDKKAAPAAVNTATAKTLAQEISRDQIAKRAYELYLARGGQHGRHEEDWQQAERELRLGRQ